MRCLSAEADMDVLMSYLRRRLHCINSWEEASFIEGSWFTRSIWMSLMQGDNVEILVKIRGTMGAALPEKLMTIELNERDIRGDIKGRNVWSQSQFNDMRLGRRGLQPESC
jgi:hypothetical protein